MRSKYTTIEKQYLADTVGKIPVIRQAAHLGRTQGSVYKFLSRNNFKLNIYRHYTKAEENYIKANMGKIPVEKIAKHINHPVFSVYRKAHELKVKPSISYKYWSAQELDSLKEVAYIGYKQMAKELNRSENAVKLKCRKLHYRLDDNIFTVSILADELGMPKYRLKYLIRQKILKTAHAPYISRFGKRPIILHEHAIINSFHKAPHLFDLFKIQNPFFKNQLREVLNENKPG